MGVQLTSQVGMSGPGDAFFSERAANRIQRGSRRPVSK